MRAGYADFKIELYGLWLDKLPLVDADGDVQSKIAYEDDVHAGPGIEFHLKCPLILVEIP